MRCRECGLEVDNDKAFCPVCGAPMKVTADYEYIQAEIANKVDRYFNEKDEENNSSDNDIDIIDDIIVDDSKEETIHSALSLKKLKGKSKKSKNSQEDLAKTRNVFGNDSVFTEDGLFDDAEDEEDDGDVRIRPSNKRNRDTRRQDVSERPRQRVVVRRKKQTAAKIITVLIIFVIIAAAALGVLAILGTFNRTDDPEGDIARQGTASLTCNISSGEVYKDPVEITISNPVEGNIFYTLDGTEPSIDSKMYTGPFEITYKDVMMTYPDVTLRAVSYSSASEKSGDLTVNFSFEYDESVAGDIAKAQEEEKEKATTENTVEELSAPFISPGSGDYFNDTEIIVTSPDGADIYYTYDGSTPTAASNRYMGPVNMIPGQNVFAAVCIKDGEVSEVASSWFNLDYGFNISADQAMNNVMDRLVNYGKVSDYNLNTYDGGYAELSHEGITYLWDYTYFVIRVDYYSADGLKTDTEYYGVGVNYGGVDLLIKDGDTYFYG